VTAFGRGGPNTATVVITVDVGDINLAFGKKNIKRDKKNGN
jgi:hypothetical protein